MKIQVEKATYYGYSPGSFYVDCPNGPENYSFVHFLRPMMLHMEQGLTPIQTGAFVLFAHGKRQRYYPRTSDMLEHWFRFSGREIPALLEKLGIPVGEPIYMQDSASADDMLKQIADAYERGNGQAAGTMVCALMYYISASIRMGAPDHAGRQKMQTLRMSIREKLDEDLTVSSMAEMVNYSTSHFQNLYRQTFGVSPMQDVSRMRMERAQYLLTHTSYSIEQIAHMLHYDSTTSFIAKFRKHTGTSPLQYRKQMQSKQKT